MKPAILQHWAAWLHCLPPRLGGKTTLLILQDWAAWLHYFSSKIDFTTFQLSKTTFTKGSVRYKSFEISPYKNSNNMLCWGGFNFPRRHSPKDRYVTKVLKFHHINRATIYWMIYVADRLKFMATTILLPYKEIHINVFTLRFPLSSQYEPIHNHRKSFQIYFQDWVHSDTLNLIIWEVH